MTDFDIQGNVVVQTGDAEAALQKLRDKQAAFLGRIGTAAMLAGTALVGSVALMGKGAAEAQTVQLGLAQSLKNTGQYSTAAMERIDSLTDSLRQQTAVDDETQKSALAFASTMHLTEAQAEKLLPRLLDMSAVTGMDLQQGFRASAQAMTGNVGLFQRYGVIIKKGADGTVDFNDVLKQLSVYAGRAAADVSGAGGAAKLFNAALGELSEKMGASLLPQMTSLFGTLTTVVEKFSALPAPLQAVITQGTLAAGVFLLIGGGAIKAVVGIAQLKIAIDTLTASAGWTALMGGAGVLGVGAAMVAIPAAAMSYAQSDDWAKKRQGIIDNFNNGPAQLGGRGTINRGVVTPSTYPSRTWTAANQAGLEAVQAGAYTSTDEQVSAMNAVASANDDLQHKLYDATHTEKQQALHDLDLELAAYRKAGDDKVTIAQYSAAKRAEIEKQYALKSAASTAAAWSPINVSGVNVSGLSSYIGSLSGAVKVKKEELQLTLKIDGTSIKVDQSALSKLKDTLGALVFAKVMAALGGSAAFGG